MAALTYALCALTALACAIMLLLSARRTGSRMLFWSGLCFAGLAISNGLIVVDATTESDLGVLRLGVSLIAVSLLLYGLVFEEK
jgi:hypothetical protein